MKKKIPPDAFAYYLGLGPGRSYKAVGERFGATKRAVAFRAESEGWQKRVREEETKVREKAEKQAAESIETATKQHLKVLRFAQGRCIEALKTMPIESAEDAIKIYALTLDKERQLRGDPGDEKASRLEEITREEIRTLLTTKAPGADGPDDF